MGVTRKLTMVIRVSVEYLLEDFGIRGGVARPHLPKLITQRILHKLVAGILVPHVVGRIISRRHGIEIITCIHGLRWQQSQVLTPQVSTQCGGVVSDLALFTIDEARNLAGILHNDTQLTVVIAQLTSIVEVAGATDHDSVVDDKQFGVDVQLFLDPIVNLFLWLALPLLVHHIAGVCHGILRETAFRSRLYLPSSFKAPFDVHLLLLFVFIVLFLCGLRMHLLLGMVLEALFHALLAHVRHAVLLVSTMNTGSHDFLSLSTLHILVLQTGLFLLFSDGRRFVQPVVTAEVEEENVLCRINALFLDLLKD